MPADGLLARRFIPAHAGNTTPRPAPSGSRPVHPRACGEHISPPLLASRTVGSSPRMRGTPRPRSRRHPGSGFIPAHAGNTSARWSPPAGRPVHPRACGEHGGVRHRSWQRGGSSPRMRGTLTSNWMVKIFRRFIPAHAGNTVRSGSVAGGHAVHPRACGEHVPFFRCQAMVDGSSPRMRGTLRFASVHRRLVRFIPAHAGNTLIDSLSCVNYKVHPRACGEHAQHRGPGGAAAGSSPRMRGTLITKSSAPAAIRFIPAHAGNTPWHTNATKSKTVHPRACGEHMGAAGRHLKPFGSSPRMRGTHLG